MFNESIRYLKDSDDAATTVLVGGLLVIFGFLIIPAIVVEGYMIRVLRRVSEGDTEAPKFDEWTELFVDGLKALVIAFVYLLIRTKLSKFTPAQATSAIVVSYYWHFVDIVWIGLFAVIYIVP